MVQKVPPHWPQSLGLVWFYLVPNGWIHDLFVRVCVLLLLAGKLDEIVSDEHSAHERG